MTKKLALGAVCLLALAACSKKSAQKEESAGAASAAPAPRKTGAGSQARPAGSSQGSVRARQTANARARQTANARPTQPSAAQFDPPPSLPSSARAARPAVQKAWKENAKAQGGKGKVYHLALKMKRGKVYHVKMATHQTITQTIFGRQQVVEQIIGFGYDLKLLSREKNGVMKVRNQYTWVRFKQKLMGRTVDYDSARGGPVPQNPMARVYAALNGASFTFHVTPTGHITKVDGMGALMKRVVDALPDSPNKAKLAEQIKKKFSDKMFRESLENIMAIYPDGGVRVGGFWTRVKQITLGMSLSTFTKYTLVKVAGGLAHLQIQGKVRTPQGAAMDTFNPQVAMHYDIHGTQSGSNTVALDDGMVRSWSLKQDLSGKVTISRPGGTANESRSWPIVIASAIDGKVTVERAR